MRRVVWVMGKVKQGQMGTDTAQAGLCRGLSTSSEVLWKWVLRGLCTWLEMLSVLSWTEWENSSSVQTQEEQMTWVLSSSQFSGWAVCSYCFLSILLFSLGLCCSGYCCMKQVELHWGLLQKLCCYPCPHFRQDRLKKSKKHMLSLLRSHKFPSVPRSLLPHDLLVYNVGCR